jgi:hypothetical protein
MTRLAAALSALPAGTKIEDFGDHYLARPPGRSWIVIYKDGHTREIGQTPTLVRN